MEGVTWSETGVPPPALVADHERLVVTAQDLRQKLREQRSGRLLLFVVDCSGSMAARRRLALAKGAVSALLRDAYRRRDQVGLIAFQGTSAYLALPPTRSAIFAARRLADLPAGGRTPLAAALLLAERALERYERRDAGPAPLVVVLSDGKANVPATGGDPWQEALRAAGRLRRRGTSAVVVDVEDGGFSLGLVEQLSAALGAPLLRVRDGAPATLVAAMRWL